MLQLIHQNQRFLLQKKLLSLEAFHQFSLRVEQSGLQQHFLVLILLEQQMYKLMEFQQHIQ